MATSTQDTTNIYPYQYPVAAPYGKDQGNLFPGYHDVEQGVVYSTPSGTPIELAESAYYRPDLSTPYQAIFQTPTGRALSYMHVQPLSLPSGVLINAGTPIGTVTNMSGGPYYGYTPSGVRHSYYNTPNVWEFGTFNNPQNAFNRDSGGSINPSSFFASTAPQQQQQGGTGSTGSTGSTGNSGSHQPLTPAGNGSSGGTTVAGDPNAQQPGDTILPILNWDISATGRTVGRYSLAAILALVALGLVIYTFRSEIAKQVVQNVA